MPWWADILDIVGLLVVIAATVFVFFFVRRRVLSRRGGTFECSVRRRLTRPSPTGARGWELGLGRYDGERLEWFRVFSFSPRPAAVYDRSLQVLGRRKPHGAEAFSLYANHVAVSVRLDAHTTVELAMSEQALTAFMAWTEAAPPGQNRVPT